MPKKNNMPIIRNVVISQNHITEYSWLVPPWTAILRPWHLQVMMLIQEHTTGYFTTCGDLHFYSEELQLYYYLEQPANETF